MRLLLDSHALLWALSDPRRLPRRLAEQLEDPATDVHVSAASTWEIAIKASLGKLRVDLEELAEAIERTGFRELPVAVRHTVRLRELPAHHRDPFDRLLVAQALTEGLTLVTHDKAFGAYSVPVVWS